ncbi:MAG: phosphoglycerate kinase [Deltaproteobacteria bacterium]|jgi:phosphoglycerate kinase|nr:phosphoglycerate kinase [Deltaproteobacteria bacterium]
MSDVSLKIRSMDELDLKGKTVLCRLDVNSPIDGATGRIKNENRLDMSLDTLRTLKSQESKVAIIAHQGDSLDYHNLMPMKEHAEKLSQKLGFPVDYIDDPCGPAAQAAVRALPPGGMIILGNLRYLAEEISTFENSVKLTPERMAGTYLVRSLGPLAEAYVNDAFSAAHRSSPSMVAFQEFLPSAAGRLFFKEVSALNKIMSSPPRPCVFFLGGAKISDAFGMLGQALDSGAADAALTGGVTANVFLMAKGIELGRANADFIKSQGLGGFVDQARALLAAHGDKIRTPSDLAFEKDGQRRELPVAAVMPDELYVDLGDATVTAYSRILAEAGAIFVNGPAGQYESPLFSSGTRRLWEATAASSAYSVIGGGDTVTAAQTFIDASRLDLVCTAGGALVQYLSGKRLPLIAAMEKAHSRHHHQQ